MIRFIDVFKVFGYWEDKSDDNNYSLSDGSAFKIDNLFYPDIEKTETSYNYYSNYVSFKEKIEGEIDGLKDTIVKELKKNGLKKFHLFSVSVDLYDERFEDFLLTIEDSGKVSIMTEVFERSNYQSILNMLHGEDLDPDGMLMDWRGFDPREVEEFGTIDYKFEMENVINKLNSEILSLVINQ